MRTPEFMPLDPERVDPDDHSTFAQPQPIGAPLMPPVVSKSYASASLDTVAMWRE